MTERLRELCDDWDFYDKEIVNPEWRQSMLQAIALEMETEFKHLKTHCRFPEAKVAVKGGPSLLRFFRHS